MDNRMNLQVNGCMITRLTEKKERVGRICQMTVSSTRWIGFTLQTGVHWCLRHTSLESQDTGDPHIPFL